MNIIHPLAVPMQCRWTSNVSEVTKLSTNVCSILQNQTKLLQVLRQDVQLYLHRLKSLEGNKCVLLATISSLMNGQRDLLLSCQPFEPLPDWNSVRKRYFAQQRQSTATAHFRLNRVAYGGAFRVSIDWFHIETNFWMSRSAFEHFRGFICLLYGLHLTRWGIAKY